MVGTKLFKARVGVLSGFDQVNATTAPVAAVVLEVGVDTLDAPRCMPCQLD